MKRKNSWFLILLLGVFFWGEIVFVKKEMLISKTENRNLSTFIKPTFDEIYDG